MELIFIKPKGSQYTVLKSTFSKDAGLMAVLPAHHHSFCLRGKGKWGKGKAYGGDLCGVKLDLKT